MPDEQFNVTTSESLAIRIGNYIWGTDPLRETSSAICLADFPNHLLNINSPCLQTLLAKLLGWMIIVGACLNKAPILINVLKNQSVAGLALGSLYGEVLMYGNSGLYGYVTEAPFTAYGENLMVALQCIILVLLVWSFTDGKSDGKSLVYKATVVATGTVYVMMILQQLSPEYYPYIIMSNWPALLFSRGTLIYQSFTEKHTGTQSIITHGMNLIGSCIRIVTTIGEVGYDLPLLCGYGISVTLNITLVLQVLYYQTNTAKVLAKAAATQSTSTKKSKKTN